MKTIKIKKVNVRFTESIDLKNALEIRNEQEYKAESLLYQ